MKSEPNTYSIDHFKKEEKCLWDGIRNYQARNFMIHDMKVEDEFLFYHSNVKPPSIVGLGRISQSAQPDPTALNKNSKYYDPKATSENPIWKCVEVEYKKTFKRAFALSEIKNHKVLENMLLLKKGMRLSIQPVTPTEFGYIVKYCHSLQRS